MEANIIWVVVPLVTVIIAVIMVFCAVMFKLMNILHDMAYQAVAPYHAMNGEESEK